MKTKEPWKVSPPFFCHIRGGRRTLQEQHPQDDSGAAAFTQSGLGNQTFPWERLPEGGKEGGLLTGEGQLLKVGWLVNRKKRKSQEKGKGGGNDEDCQEMERRNGGGEEYWGKYEASHKSLLVHSLFFPSLQYVRMELK